MLARVTQAPITIFLAAYSNDTFKFARIKYISTYSFIYIFYFIYILLTAAEFSYRRNAHTLSGHKTAPRSMGTGSSSPE